MKKYDDKRMGAQGAEVKISQVDVEAGDKKNLAMTFNGALAVLEPAMPALLAFGCRCCLAFLAC